MAANFNLIKDLIEDSIDKFSDYGNNISNPYIEIRPIIDAIALYLEKNIAIKITNLNGDLISTYKVDGIEKINSNNSDKFNFENFILWIAEVKGSKIVRLRNNDIASLQKLFKWLKGDHKDELNFAANYKSDKSTGILFKEYNVEEYNIDSEKIKIIAELRKIITESIRIFENNRSIRIQNVNVPNVFHVIRYASKLRKKYDYTAQILLSEGQKKNITEYFKKKSSDISIDSLEDPLDKDTISISDDCFRYECVRFDKYKETLSTSITDKNRQKHENIIYNNITTEEKKVFYVPIHLNGAAWMAIYRIEPKKKRKIDFLSFYRNKISIIATQIRKEAIKSFFSLIRLKIEEIFKDSDNVSQHMNMNLNLQIEKLNEYMLLLSAYFPYYLPIFPANKLNENSIYAYIELLLIPEYEFSFFMNEIWKNEIDYDNISINDFSKKIKANINRIYLKFAIEKEKQEKEIEINKRKSLVSNATHVLKTELEVSLKPLGIKMGEYSDLYKFSDNEKWHVKNLNYSINRFYGLTGLFNLVNKMIDERKMIDSGLKDNLFTNERTVLIFKDYFKDYKSINTRSKLSLSENNSTYLAINIFNVWLSQELLGTFINMVFQNIDDHGAEENNQRVLDIKQDENFIELKNKTWFEEVSLNDLTGNLFLFKELINLGGKMKMDIISKNYEFKITLEWIK